MITEKKHCSIWQFVIITSCFLILMLNIGCITDGGGDTQYDEYVYHNTKKIAELSGMSPESFQPNFSLKQTAEKIVFGFPDVQTPEVTSLSIDELSTVKRRLQSRPQLYILIENYQRFLQLIEKRQFLALPFLHANGMPIENGKADILPLQLNDFESYMQLLAQKLSINENFAVHGETSNQPRSFPLLFDIIGRLQNTEKFHGQLISVEDINTIERATAAYPEIFQHLLEMHEFISSIVDKRLIIIPDSPK